jgi:hypothetical protein
VFVAVPTMIVLGLGFVLLPLTTGATSVGLVAALMGLGNGISSGIVLTLGADASPPQDRAQFLGGWRVCSDLGNTTGPLVIGVVSAFAPRWPVTMGVLMAGAGWLVGGAGVCPGRVGEVKDERHRKSEMATSDSGLG